tara:strand:+ start:1514 stop:1810 length:297 start_codon:yes stop_codon:yes gene_type:complete
MTYEQLLTKFVEKLNGYKNLFKEYNKARKFWTQVAKKNKWLPTDLFVILYVNKCDLEINDSVYQTRENKQDIVVFTECDMDYCEQCNLISTGVGYEWT